MIDFTNTERMYEIYFNNLINLFPDESKYNRFINFVSKEFFTDGLTILKDIKILLVKDNNINSRYIDAYENDYTKDKIYITGRLIDEDGTYQFDVDYDNLLYSLLLYIIFRTSNKTGLTSIKILLFKYINTDTYKLSSFDTILPKSILDIIVLITNALGITLENTIEDWYRILKAPSSIYDNTSNSK